jgi:tetratricopeptide (TPR) repeat protein
VSASPPQRTLHILETLDLPSSLLSPRRLPQELSFRATTSIPAGSAPYERNRFSRLRDTFRQAASKKQPTSLHLHSYSLPSESLKDPLPRAAMPSPTSGTQAQTVAQFRALIWHSLDNGLLETALFTAERLVAFDIKNGDAVHLHALCLFRNGQYRQAEALTKRWIRHVGCAYIFAQCCLALGNKKEAAGIAALEECKRLWVPVTGWSEFFHTPTTHRLPLLRAS